MVYYFKFSSLEWQKISNCLTEQSNGQWHFHLRMQRICHPCHICVNSGKNLLPIFIKENFYLYSQICCAGYKSSKIDGWWKYSLWNSFVAVEHQYCYIAAWGGLFSRSNKPNFSDESREEEKHPSCSVTGVMYSISRKKYDFPCKKIKKSRDLKKDQNGGTRRGKKYHTADLAKYAESGKFLRKKIGRSDSEIRFGCLVGRSFGQWANGIQEMWDCGGGSSCRCCCPAQAGGYQRNATGGYADTLENEGDEIKERRRRVGVKKTHRSSPKNPKSAHTLRWECVTRPN